MSVAMDPADPRAGLPRPAAPRPSRPRIGGAFVGTAGGRLLPAALPFTFFAAAALFHVAAWAALALGATAWAEGRAGLGWPLAALHATTLGVLVATAIGASLQLLPVATLQPVRRPTLIGWTAALYLPGCALVVAGMGLGAPTLLAAGALPVLAALVAWAALLAPNLRGARGMPGVVLHGWGALAALALLAVSAAALVAVWIGQPLLDRDTARALHLAAGVFGLVGLLVLGLSAILLPLLALAAVPSEREQIAGGAAAIGAVGLAALAALLPAATMPLRALALVAGAAAFAIHLRAMRRVLRTGMRRDLGDGGRLIRASWLAAPAALLLAAAAVALDALGHEGGRLAARLFIVAAVGGWLLAFLLGVLQRIAPFLASMHAAQARRRAPTPSALTLAPALGWHRRAHGAALLALLGGTALGAPQVVLAAALVGLGGALAWAAFFAVLLKRFRAALTAPARP